MDQCGSIATNRHPVVCRSRGWLRDSYSAIQNYKETAPMARAVKSGTIFHYTSINAWICSAIKCAGYHSTKVESTSATMDSGWGKNSNSGHRIQYATSHLCA